MNSSYAPTRNNRLEILRSSDDPAAAAPVAAAVETAKETPVAETLIEGDGVKPSLLSGDPPAEGEAKTETALTLEALTLPEGFDPTSPHAASFVELMNSEVAPAERANQLLSLFAKYQGDSAEAAQAAAQETWDTVQKQWQDEARALPDIGGAQLNATLSTLKQGLTNVGAGDEFFKIMDQTGAGNNPQVIRVLHSLTKGLVEKQPNTGSVSNPPKSQAERLFPSKE